MRKIMGYGQLRCALCGKRERRFLCTAVPLCRCTTVLEYLGDVYHFGSVRCVNTHLVSVSLCSNGVQGGLCRQRWQKQTHSCQRTETCHTAACCLFRNGKQKCCGTKVGLWRITHSLAASPCRQWSYALCGMRQSISIFCRGYIRIS